MRQGFADIKETFSCREIQFLQFFRAENKPKSRNAMKVFVQSKQIWFECGVRVEESENENKSKFRYVVNFCIVLASLGSFALLSILYITSKISELQIIEVLYVGMQIQMPILGLASLFCLRFHRQNIRRMIHKVQERVDLCKSSGLKGARAENFQFCVC